MKPYSFGKCKTFALAITSPFRARSSADFVRLYLTLTPSILRTARQTWYRHSSTSGLFHPPVIVEIAKLIIVPDFGLIFIGKMIIINHYNQIISAML